MRSHTVETKKSEVSNTFVRQLDQNLWHASGSGLLELRSLGYMEDRDPQPQD